MKIGIRYWNNIAVYDSTNNEANMRPMDCNGAFCFEECVFGWMAFHRSSQDGGAKDDGLAVVNCRPMIYGYEPIVVPWIAKKSSLLYPTTTY